MAMDTDWTSSIYAFFSPVPAIAYVNRRDCHVFKCLGKSCKHSMHWFLDKADKGSTGNMRRHVQSCWGQDILDAAGSVATLEASCALIQRFAANGSIAHSFKWKGQGKPAYSTGSTQRKKQESLRPYEIVRDHGFQCLMKTGHLEYYLPHPSTVLHNIKIEYEGELNFTTDAWTSPNHKALVAFTVHLANKGKPGSMILDVVEVVKVHILS
ncbi:hypothetical protein BKA83DRAFT_4465309 [Pisolithus microcarpus]|nr:hypothetical protein BKA83DRAFT_4465309 [Pisolithus microcarpus]